MGASAVRVLFILAVCLLTLRSFGQVHSISGHAHSNAAAHSFSSHSYSGHSTSSSSSRSNNTYSGSSTSTIHTSHYYHPANSSYIYYSSRQSDYLYDYRRPSSVIYINPGYHPYIPPADSNSGPGQSHIIPSPHIRHKTPVSLELQQQLAFGGRKMATLIPEAQLNIGNFSSNLRMTYLTEPFSEHPGLYKTIDWQIAQVHFPIDESFQPFIGGGIMYEDITHLTFPEILFGANIRFSKKLTGFAAYRQSADLVTNATPRSEWQAKVYYPVLEHKHAVINLSAGLLYQKYYSAVDATSGMLGLSFRIY